MLSLGQSLPTHYKNQPLEAFFVKIITGTQSGISNRLKNTRYFHLLQHQTLGGFLTFFYKAYPY